MCWANSPLIALKKAAWYGNYGVLVMASSIRPVAYASGKGRGKNPLIALTTAAGYGEYVRLVLASSIGPVADATRRCWENSLVAIPTPTTADMDPILHKCPVPFAVAFGITTFRLGRLMAFATDGKV